MHWLPRLLMLVGVMNQIVVKHPLLAFLRAVPVVVVPLRSKSRGRSQYMFRLSSLYVGGLISQSLEDQERRHDTFVLTLPSLCASHKMMQRSREHGAVLVVVHSHHQAFYK